MSDSQSAGLGQGIRRQKKKKRSLEGGWGPYRVQVECWVGGDHTGAMKNAVGQAGHITAPAVLHNSLVFSSSLCG